MSFNDADENFGCENFGGDEESVVSCQDIQCRLPRVWCCPGIGWIAMGYQCHGKVWCQLSGGGVLLKKF